MIASDQNDEYESLTAPEKPEPLGDYVPLTEAPASERAAAAASEAEKPSAKVATRFTKRAQPSEEPELGWGETLEQAGRNILPSTGEALLATGKAIVNLPQTAEAFGQLGKGALSKFYGAIGAEQDPAEKAKNEQLINALGNHYKEVYGSVKGFKQALAEDPASVLLDASMLLTGGGTAAAKIAGKTGTLAKAAEVATKAGSMIDPITGAAKIAKTVVGKPVGMLSRGILSKTTAVPSSLIGLAQDAGATAEKADRETFRKFISGEGSASEIHAVAEDALRSIKNRASDEFMQKHAGLASKKIDLSPVRGAWAKAYQDATKGAGFKDRIAALKEMKDMINRSPNDLENVHALKQQIYDLHANYPQAKSAIDDVYHAAKEAMSNPTFGGDKAYSDMMDFWQSHINNVNNIRKDLGPGTKASSTAVLAKMLRKAKSPQGQNVLDSLIKERPELKYMLSGAALSSWHPGGVQSLIDAVMASPFAYMGMPGKAAAALAAGSPRLVGETAYKLGQAERLAGMAEKPAYAAGRLQELENQPENTSGVPRNVRNHNVGNLIDSRWTRSQPGYVGSDGTFAKFESPEAGYAAADRLLQLKGTQGHDTPRSLIKNWAPDAPESYVNAVASALGITPEERMDLSNNEVRRVILGVIRRFEGDRSAAEGGRIERKAGGKVTDKHEMLVQRLMRLARNAKQLEEKRTEPILNAPDESVVKALDIAQQAI